MVCERIIFGKIFKGKGSVYKSGIPVNMPRTMTGETAYP
jgi:hypothetical protein